MRAPSLVSRQATRKATSLAKPSWKENITPAEALSYMADQSEDLAPQACIACREKKRKCTRELPTCSLCGRSRRRCEYPVKALNPATDGSGPGPEPFPALFFLDLYTFEERRQVIPSPTGAFFDVHHGWIGNREQVQYYAEKYFSSIHLFLPIVSKLRFYQKLNKQCDRLDADMAVLSLAMQMHCQATGTREAPGTDIYTLAKNACRHAEQNNIISLRILQAFLLIAMYEIGHAIYPAAYLTVGHCARLGYGMGIHNRMSGPQMFSRPVSWAEAEERRRVWWAVVVLDRYVNLGGGNRPFASCEAKADDLLPMDEDKWDQGEPIVIQPLAVSAYPSLQASPFARTCQASHLLSHVLRHLNEEQKDPELHYQEAIQIHRTINTFKLAMHHELNDPSKSESIEPRLTAMAICYSAQLTLYDANMCADADDFKGVGIPAQVEMQQIAIPGIKETCVFVAQLANIISAAMESRAGLKPSPFTMDCLYQAASLITSYARETGNEEYSKLSVDIMGTLKLLAKHWNVAGEYLKILNVDDQ